MKKFMALAMIAVISCGVAVSSFGAVQNPNVLESVQEISINQSSDIIDMSQYPDMSNEEALAINMGRSIQIGSPMLRSACYKCGGSRGKAGYSWVSTFKEKDGYYRQYRYTDIMCSNGCGTILYTRYQLIREWK